MGEEADSLAQSSLQEGEDKGECGEDVVSTVVHEFTEEVEFLTAGLQLDQLTQPDDRDTQERRRNRMGGGGVKVNTRGDNNKCVCASVCPNQALLEDMVTGPDHGFGGHE